MKQGLDMCFLLDTAYMYVFAVTEIVIIFPDYVLNWSVIPLYAQTKVCGYYNVIPSMQIYECSAGKEFMQWKLILK